MIRSILAAALVAALLTGVSACSDEKPESDAPGAGLADRSGDGSRGSSTTTGSGPSTEAGRGSGGEGRGGGGDGEEGEESGGGESGGGEEGGEAGGGEGGGGGGGGPATDPQGPDLAFFTLPECSVVPGGGLSGADNLTMFVAVRNGGPGPFRGLAPVTVRSDTGLTSSTNAAISTGSSFNGLQVDLSTGSYGRSHRFTITADPANETTERDESNNVLRITVDLPSRPSSATDVPCTSP